MQRLISHGEMLARENGALANTGYLLLAMISGRDAAANLLKTQGLTDAKIRAGLRDLEAEPRELFASVFEKAEKVAAPFRAPEPAPLHLLVAMTGLKETHASRIIEQHGLSRIKLRTQALRHLTGVTREYGDKRAPAAAARPDQPEALPLPEPLQKLSDQTDRERAAEALSKTRPLPGPKEGLRAAAIGLNARKFIEMGRDLEQKQRRKRGGRAPSSRGRERIAPARPVEPEPLSALAATSAEAPGAYIGPASIQARALPVSRAAAQELREPLRLTEDQYPLLSAIGRNLTREASEGLFDDLVGRTPEMERMADVLNKRRANSPCLTGAAGVGKTAVVEAFALRVYRGELPGLEGRVIIEVRPADLLAGTSVRGALSERLGQLREEVAGSSGRVILFFDEIHALLASSDGAEAVQELKTALGRGELPCIAATTDEEYGRYIESDAALARRFTRVPVGEPTLDEAIRILEAVGPAYCEHHNVAFSREALTSAVRLSARYIQERALPDKAIALLDLAGARARRREATRVEANDVAHVLARQLGVPVERVAASYQERLLRLEEDIAEEIVGHRHVLTALCETLRRNAAGFRTGRPIGSFLFLGPTGVGKTETAKALEKLLFPGKGGLIRLDMSEFSESHAVARLIGAPPGYVGHEEGGQLTQAVRRHPYSLVLLDEVEKAHPDVLKLLLQVLEDGRLTDGLGRTVVFENTLVVMTSNLGSDLRIQRRQVGFGAARQTEEMGEVAAPILQAAREALPPELWNRIDEPLVFEPLTRSEVGDIARLMIRRVARQIRDEHGVAFSAEEGAVEALIEAGGYDPDFGARPMRRTIQNLIEAPLARMILAGEVGAEDRVVAAPGTNGAAIVLRRLERQGLA